MEYLKKNWLVIAVGCLSALLGVLTIFTVAKLKKTTPLAPTAPEKKPQALTKACTLTFKLSAPALATPTQTASPAAMLASGPTSTPTPSFNEPPICTRLSADPLSGEAPLEVTFTGEGVDPDGKIVAFEFDFGDQQKKTVAKDVQGAASHLLLHTYSSSGSYLASLQIRDNNGELSEPEEACQVEIKVEEKGLGGSATDSASLDQETTPTASPTAELLPETGGATETPIPVPEVPEAGIALPTILAILSGSLLVLLGILL